eukprot:CAMPEP_0206136828 /NCGR_PEP_ID=MMETSP1473-20131121/2050_1 /ASSEMBLY_ACC=CAM_ASM_001109 /TAXON_ID=1461547 /ORGANISM="Stichococcus sp, Strain RCC1054" /LENGTH=672 /DNA_ID=CAMNT_0053529625 /DNA_START=113 /DNA_END=2131 /DNA_ORIENTATION=-
MHMRLDFGLLQRLEGELQCPICLERLTPPCARLSCTHHFCRACLNEALRSNPRCPLCKEPARRRDVQSDDHVDRISNLVGELGLLGQFASPDHLKPADDGKKHLRRAALGTERLCPSVLQQQAAGADDSQAYESALHSLPLSGDNQPDSVAPSAPGKDVGSGEITAGPFLNSSDQENEPPHQMEEARLEGAMQEEGSTHTSTSTDPYGFHGSDSVPDLPAALHPPRNVNWMFHASTQVTCASEHAAVPAKGTTSARVIPTAAPATNSRSVHQGPTPSNLRLPSGITLTGNAPVTPSEAAPPGSSAPLAQSGVARESQSGGRRIPGRLVPWRCSACTLENKACAANCELCDTPRSAPPQRRAAAHLTARDATAPTTLGVTATDGGQATAPLGKHATGASKRRQSPAPAIAEASRPPAKRAALAARQPAAAGSCTPAAGRDCCSGSLPPCRKLTTGPEAGKAAKKRSSIVLIKSGLRNGDPALLSSFSREAGVRVVTSWTNSVTHVVCGLGSDGNPKRTLTFLKGVLLGKWVVASSWLQDPKRGTPGSEERHEVQNGPQLGRLNSHLGGLPLLHNHSIFLAGQYGSRDKVADIAKAAGAKVLKRAPPEMPGSITKEQSATVAMCLYDEDHCSPLRGVITGQVPHVWHVSSRWLMDSAQQFMVQPPERYLVAGRS